MAMLQPLQYQSMFVPTDIGLMNQQIMKRDQEYAQNEAMLAAAQDKYAQVASHPSATQHKNQLLDQLNTDINKMIEDYGGDIGSIDRRTLVDRVNTIRPQIQDLQRHASIADEQRKVAAKYGPFADIQSDISDYGAWVEQGRPDYKIGDTREYSKFLEGNFGDIAKRIQGSGLWNSNTAGFLGQTIQRGISEQEIPQYAELMSNFLQETTGASQSAADNIAMGRAMQLFQGQQRQYRQDASPSTKTPPLTGPATTHYYGDAKTDQSVKKIDDQYSAFEEAIGSYKNMQDFYSNNVGVGAKISGIKGALKNVTGRSDLTANNIISVLDGDSEKGANLKSGLLDLYNQFNPDSENLVKDDAGNITGVVPGRTPKVAAELARFSDADPLKQAESYYNKALKPFKDNPLYSEMVDVHGSDPIHAAGIITERKKQMYAQHSRYDKPVKNEVKNQIFGDLVNVESFTMSDGSDGVLVDGKNMNSKKFSDKMKGLKASDVEQTAFNLVDGTMEMTIKESGKDREVYEIPVGNIKNEAVRHSMNRIQSFMNGVYKQGGTRNSEFSSPDGYVKYIHMSDWNQSLNNGKGGYEDKLIKYNWDGSQYIPTESGTTDEYGNEITIDGLMSEFHQTAANALSDHYGREVKYTPIKR
jgi:hypothetical protein